MESIFAPPKITYQGPDGKWYPLATAFEGVVDWGTNMDFPYLRQEELDDALLDSVKP